MRLRKWPMCLLLVGLLLSLSGGITTVQAQSIGINCSDTDNADTVMALTDVAGVVPQANWNDLGGLSGTDLALVDDSGAATGATVTWTSNNTWRTDIDQTISGDYRMMKGYLDYQHNPATPIQVTIENIPYGRYDLYVYFDGDGGEWRNGSYDIRNPTTSAVIAGPIHYQDPASTHFDGTYIEVPATSTTDEGVDTPAGNYCIFEGLNDSSILVYAQGTTSESGDTFRVQTNGIQIIDKTPRPEAGNPDPPDDPDLTGAEVATNKTMSWDIAEDPNNGAYGAGPEPFIMGHYVYLTTDKAALEAIEAGDISNPDIYRGLQTPASNTTYFPGVYDATTNPGGLDTDKVYYWRIDERAEYTSEDPNIWKGDIWTFQTTKLLPVFNPGGQPQDTNAFPGDPAALSVSVTSATTAHYQWKRVDPAGDVGSDSPTLSFTPVTVGDEGEYYCVITNDAGSVSSDNAWLDVKRLVGRWQFNGDMDDSTPSGLDGEIDPGAGYGGYENDPNYSTRPEDAIEGSNSIEFHNDVSEIVLIPGTDTDLYNFHKRSGLTVSCWTKTTTGGWGALFNRGNRVTAPWLGWNLNANDTSGVMTVREGPTDITGTTNVKDGQWHLLTGTYDPATGEAQIYVDGVLENSEINTSPLTSVSIPIHFGASDITGGTLNTDTGEYDYHYDGFIDDARLYNYVLSPFDIAYLYTTIMQDAVICALPITYDLDPSGTSYCIQDLKDFAAFAATWLECNRVPDCWNTPEHPID
jgi:concanavalin A-like lectin/glucanase superfamily protein/Ig-like domain-containing protein